MPFVAAVPSTALLLLVVLSAKEQSFKGLVTENWSMVLVGNNVTATAGAAAMCYRRSDVDEEANPSKTVLQVAPLAVCLDDDTVLLSGTLLPNVNGAGSVPSPASGGPSAAHQSMPPPMLADARSCR